MPVPGRLEPATGRLAGRRLLDTDDIARLEERPVALVAFLDHAAAAARSAPVTLPRAGQILYQIVKAGNRTRPYGFNYLCLVMWYVTPATGRTGFPTGVSLDGRPSDLRPTDRKQRCPTRTPKPVLGSYVPSTHGYPMPGSLPRTPSALLAALSEDAGRGASYWNTDVIDTGNAGIGSVGLTSRTAIVFVLIERLLQVPIPGALRAALCQATALIPGVRLVHSATDIAGRPGVAIELPAQPGDVYHDNGRSYSGPGISCEYILDRVSYRFLGLVFTIGPPSFDPKRPSFRWTEGFAVLRSGRLVSPARH